VSEPVQKSATPAAVDALDAEVREVLAMCGGNAVAALRTALIANAFLECELDLLSAQVSPGFTRGRLRRSAKKRPPDEAGGSDQGKHSQSLPGSETHAVARGEGGQQ
jgi:hypothetical protein